MYILNHYPTKVMQNSIPYEVRLSKKPSIGHLKSFGLTYYKYVAKESKNKLDEKSIKCIFVG